MSNFEKVIAIVVEDVKHDLRCYADYEIDCWQDILDAFAITSAEMKENIDWTLTRKANAGEIPWCFQDDLSIEDSDGSIKTYRQLTNAVRKQLFA